MNILIISHLYYPNLGGVEIAVDNLSKQFIKKGHRVQIITSRWPKTLPKSEYINGVKVTRLPFRLPSYNPISFLKFVIRAIECMISLFFIARREKFDLINLHYVRENALYALILSHFKNLSLITCIHGEDIVTFPLEGKLNSWVVKQSLKRATQIISNSKAFLKMTSNMFGEEILKKSVVLGNGVDLTKVDEYENNDEILPPFILGVGRFINKKGFDILIRAFALVKNSFPDIKLFLIGDGPERHFLKKLSQELGLEQSIVFHGIVENQNVWKYFMNCDFFVLPSRKEPFGIVILEAMAAKKAVIAMDVGGVPEIVQDTVTGLLVKNHSPKALVDAMIYLLENPEFASDLGKNGRKLVESRYTWEIIADRYLKVYQSTL